MSYQVSFLKGKPPCVYLSFRLHSFCLEVVITKNHTKPQEKIEEHPTISVTIHYTENGPSLNDCMVSIISAHLSKSTIF